MLAVSGYVAIRRLSPILIGAGCRAVAGRQSIALDTEQASIAATIAGVAHKQSMPRDAVTIAYAAALQESKMHNLDYGDMDSVGVFQQRPSEGWGPARDLEDPVYATTKFFRALAKVPRYQTLPVYKAAQDVQRSADGRAYIQYEQMAADLAGVFTGRHARGIYCWSSSVTPAPRQTDLGAAGRALAHAFGTIPSLHATADQRTAMLISVQRVPLGWAVAAWFVTHAARYGIHEVRYGGYQWRASAGAHGWTRDAGAPPAGSVELS